MYSKSNNEEPRYLRNEIRILLHWQWIKTITATKSITISVGKIFQ